MCGTFHCELATKTTQQLYKVSAPWFIGRSSSRKHASEWSSTGRHVYEPTWGSCSTSHTSKTKEFSLNDWWSGQHFLQRQLFSSGSFVVCVWRQRSSDQDDHKGKKPYNETCFQNPQSCSCLVVWSHRFGLHTTAREPKRSHFRAPAFKNTTKIPRKDPQEREERKLWRETATHRGSHPSKPHPSGPHPSGPHPCIRWEGWGGGRGGRFWPKSNKSLWDFFGLSRIGLSRIWPNARFQNPQSCLWLVNWSDQFGPKNPNQIHRHQKPTCWHPNLRKFHTWRMDSSFVFV